MTHRQKYMNKKFNPIHSQQTDTIPYPSSRPVKIRVGMLATGLAAFILSGCATLNTQTLQPNKSKNEISSNTPSNSTLTPPPIIAATGDPNFVVAVVQNVGNAVVRIDSARTVTSQVPEEFSDPFFRRFFGNRIPQPRQRTQRGSGSGFIIDSSGRILTNAHVVDGADQVTVTLKDGRTYDGEVLGEDPVTDVAVIKISTDNLPTIKLGNSDNLQTGEAVIAIGNPLGLNNTVTSGILSATDRSSSDIGASDKRVDYLQTDAAINPGNSGGPLLNARGEVIGMNTAIIRGAQGLGFAIPINTAQKIAQELITKGRVDHPYLGIQMATLTPSIKQRILNRTNGRVNIVANQGVLLVRIVPQSPAAFAGLRPGDVVKSMNNQTITNVEDVQKIVENSKVGTSLSMEVERNSRSIKLTVVPAPLPSVGK